MTPVELRFWEEAVCASLGSITIQQGHSYDAIAEDMAGIADALLEERRKREKGPDFVPVPIGSLKDLWEKHFARPSFCKDYPYPGPFCWECGKYEGCHHNLHGCKIFGTEEWQGLCRECADRNGAKHEAESRKTGAL